MADGKKEQKDGSDSQLAKEEFRGRKTRIRVKRGEYLVESNAKKEGAFLPPMQLKNRD